MDKRKIWIVKKVLNTSNFEVFQTLPRISFPVYVVGKIIGNLERVGEFYCLRVGNEHGLPRCKMREEIKNKRKP